MCIICCNTLEAQDDLREITLECGHTFHVSCITNWFRLGESTCPLCRNNPTPEVQYRSPHERFLHISRLKSTQWTPHVRRRMKHLSSWKTKKFQARVHLKELRETYRHVFSLQKRLEKRLFTCEEKASKLEEEIGNLPVDGVPMVESREDSDDDGW